MRATKLLATERGLRWPLPYLEYRQLPEQQKEIADRLYSLQWERRTINEVLAAIRDDSLSIRHGTPCDEAEKLWRPFEERYWAAWTKAREEWERECLQIPVDDAAWAEELEQRERQRASP
jgi:hypothetical protein